MSPPEILRLLILAALNCVILADDFYELLGVTREADSRTIRKAFKKLALSAHPDKNPDDAEAHENFLRINRAYEVLKDEEMRKKYDMYGEEGLKEDGPSGRGYQSWNFYQQDFGIYDDDMEIITLGKTDFEQSVSGTSDVWFINFYSPHCSHCHELAPTWREVARTLEGVIRIGAVNCEDDWHLCRSQQIQSYPSLFLYPWRTKYNGPKTMDALMKFALKYIKYPVVELTDRNFPRELAKTDQKSKPWFITFCGDTGDCMQKLSSTKLAAMLSQLVTVAEVDCLTNERLCALLGVTGGNYYYAAGQVEEGKGVEFTSLDAKELANEILKLQGDIPMLKEVTVKDIIAGNQQMNRPWLIHFVEGSTHDLELRKLPVMLQSEVMVARVDCRTMKGTCNEIYLKKFPQFVLFKMAGGYEIHHGRHAAHDVAAFAKDSSNTPVTVLSPRDFPDRVITGGKPWFVDFYAPWCPPCMRLLPEFRKASKRMREKVSFGTVDCTVHGQLCNEYGVRSYPTTIFYNQTVPHQFHGHHAERHILEFIEDTLSPSVISLDEDSFERILINKPQSDMWLVDFFAPWCGPCQQLSPEWRRLAKELKQTPNVHVAQVDCTANQRLCSQQGIRGYPSIIAYPIGSLGTSTTHHYNGWFRDAHNIKLWAMELMPSPVKNLNQDAFVDILKSKEPWIIDFYAPWCGHCQVFAPEFKWIAEQLEGKVKAGKVNCEMHQSVCRAVRIQAYPTLKFYEGTGGMVAQQRASGVDVAINDSNFLLKDILKRLRKSKQNMRDEL